MPLQGKAKADYQREYKRRKRSPSGSPQGSPTPERFPSGSPHVASPGSPLDVGAHGTLPHRTAGKAPEECGYPNGQVEVHKGPQGQNLWRLRGHYDLPNDILCHNASKERKPLYTLDELKAMFPDSKYLRGV